MLKKYFDTNVDQKKLDIGLLLLRLLSGGMMLTHGYSKLLKLFAGDFQFPDPLGIGGAGSLALTVFSEVLCSLLILLGFGTRLATIPLIITMLVAIFIVHGGDPIGQKELAIFYFGIYLVLFLLGSGKYSLDNKFKS